MNRDADSDLPNHAEYTVARRAEGKNLLARTLLVCGYVIFAATYFLAAAISGLIQVVAMLPLFVYILVLATWRYVAFEYCVQTGAGVLRVLKVIGAGKKHQRLQISLKEASDFVPVRHHALQEDRARSLVIYDCRGSTKTESAYGLYFTDDKQRPAVLYIETTPKLVRSVVFYMPKHPS